MPYCREDVRLAVYERGPDNAPELNYELTMTILAYLGDNANYQRYCDVEGVLGHIGKELYRRRVGPYEDLAIARNGDINGYKP